MIFSVQISNPMFCKEHSPDLVQIHVRETVSGIFLAQMELPPKPSLAHGGSDAKELQRASFDASTRDREPTWRNSNDGGS